MSFSIETDATLIVSTKMDVLKEAQLILTVTSAIHDIVHPEHLQPGSVVCDVARPRDVSAMVAAVYRQAAIPTPVGFRRRGVRAARVLHRGE